MSVAQIPSLWPIFPGKGCSEPQDGHPDALWRPHDALIGSPWRILHPMKSTSLAPWRAHIKPREGHISNITQGASGACFSPPGLPSRTQKCDAYCHNFMRPRRSTGHAVVTEISAQSLVFPFQVPLSLNFYSRFFKFCGILFYEMHNYAEYYSKTHKKCINMPIIV